MTSADVIRTEEFLGKCAEYPALARTLCGIKELVYSFELAYCNPALAPHPGDTSHACDKLAQVLEDLAKHYRMRAAQWMVAHINLRETALAQAINQLTQGRVQSTPQAIDLLK